MNSKNLNHKILMGAMALILFASMSCNSQQTSQTKKSNDKVIMNNQIINKILMENKGKTYSIIFLNITDEKGYDDYRKSSDELRLKYGGHIEREFDVMGQKGNIPNFEAPNRIIVMYWDEPNGNTLLMKDEKYQKAQAILKSSTSAIRVVDGTSEMFQSSDSEEAGRMYLMKISYYKEDTEGRLKMLQEIGSAISPYNFYTERMVMVNEAFGFDKPSEVTIHFHDKAIQNEQLQKDEVVTKAIGEYNNKYLTFFVYIPLKLIPR